MSSIRVEERPQGQPRPPSRTVSDIFVADQWKGPRKQDGDEKLCPGCPLRHRVPVLVHGFDDQQVLGDVAVPVGTRGGDPGRFGGGVDIEGRASPRRFQFGGGVRAEHFGGGHHALG